MKRHKLEILRDREEFLEQQIQRQKRKIRRLQKRAKYLLNYLTTVGTSSKTRTGFNKYQWTMRERELISSNKLPAIIAKIIKLTD